MNVSKIVLILIVSVLILSCNPQKKTDKNAKVQTEQEKLEHRYKYAEMELKFENEKIQLLSSIKQIHPDTTFLILKEYLAHNSEFSKFDDSASEKYNKSILEISNKFKLSKAKIASLIFSYKFETLTNDEIGESSVEYTQQQLNEQYEYDVDYDPRQ